MREASGRGVQRGGAGGQHGRRVSRWQGELRPSTSMAAYDRGPRFPSQRGRRRAEGCFPGEEVVAEPGGRQAAEQMAQGRVIRRTLL